MHTNKFLVGIIGILGMILIVNIYYMKKQQDRFEKTILEIQYSQSQGKDKKADPYKEIAVNNTLKKIAPEIQKCYNIFIETNPEKTDGFVEIDWIVFPEGKVKKVELVNSDLNSDVLNACIFTKIQNTEFPPPPFSTETYLTYKYNFKKMN